MINSKIKNIFISSWNLYANHALHLTGLCFGVMLIAMICNFIGTAAINPLSIQSLIFSLSSRLFNIGLSLGLIKFFLIFNDTQEIGTVKTLFSSFDMIFRYFNASILFAILIIIVLMPGFIILSIASDFSSLFGVVFSALQFTPDNINLNYSTLDTSNFIIHNNILFVFGIVITITNIIWVSLRFQFYQYIIVDEECGSIQALKKSYELTNTHINLLLQSLLILIGINCLGLLVFGVGLLITIPLSMLFWVKLYLGMKRKSL